MSDAVISPQLEWKPQEGKQTEALTWRIYELLYGGARGGGKSEAGRAWISRDIHHPLFRGLVIRKNGDDLKDWLDKAKRLFLPMGAEIVGNPAEIRFKSGGIIRTGHFKDDNAYEKYQGQEYQRMVLEELQQIVSEERYLKLLSSCRSTVPELPAEVFATANPGGKGHAWIKARFIDPAPPGTPFLDPITGRGRIFIPATIEDNPILMKNDPGYVAFLDGLPENLRQAWRYGRWDVFAGQYFNEWNPVKHVVTPFRIPVSWRKFGAYDHGRAKPACFKWYALDESGNVYCYRELYVNKEDGSDRWEAEDIAKEVTRITNDANYGEGEVLEYVVADAAIFTKTGAGETIAEIFKKNGVGKMGTNIPLLIPSHKDRIAGWTIMHQMLKWTAETEPRMKYFNTCVDSIRTIPGLIHSDINLEDLDSDGEDHAADTDRYFLQTIKSKRTASQQTHVERKMKDFHRKMGIIKDDPIRLDRFKGV